MTQLRRRWSVVSLLVVVFWLLGSLLQTQEAYAEGKKVSGTGKVEAILSQVAMYPGDHPQHEVTLTSRRDVLQSADPNWNNVQTHTVGYFDSTAGTGAHRGTIVVVHPGGDKTFSAIEGMTKRVTKPDGSPEVTFEGKSWFTGGTGKFTGITGGGTYKGQLTNAGPTYEWEAEYEIRDHHPTTARGFGEADLAIAADWVLIPDGKFVMGATADQKADFYRFGGSPQWMSFAKPLVESSGPAHDVYLDGFYIFRYEVTNSQYQKFVSATGHRNSGSVADPRFNGPNQPVVTVTWNDAQSFCAWIGARLPTEAEWEKAARGTEGFIYPWGNTWDAAKLRSMDGIAHQALPSIEEWENWRKQNMRNTPEAKPADVGSYPQGASPYGVMDMAGNVWEWVADRFDPTYYANSPKNNPKGPESGDFRVLRGGAWDTPIPVNFTWLRQTFMPPSDARAVTGFRCAKDYRS